MCDVTVQFSPRTTSPFSEVVGFFLQIMLLLVALPILAPMYAIVKPLGPQRSVVLSDSGRNRNARAYFTFELVLVRTIHVCSRVGGHIPIRYG